MDGLAKIAIERAHQVTKLGFTVRLDAEINDRGQLRLAARNLIDVDPKGVTIEEALTTLPENWNLSRWLTMLNYPLEKRMAIAGALLAADLDRLEYIQRPEGPTFEDGV